MVKNNKANNKLYLHDFIENLHENPKLGLEILESIPVYAESPVLILATLQNSNCCFSKLFGYYSCMTVPPMLIQRMMVVVGG